MQSSVKKRVGILRGGKGKHYESSLQKGGEIISLIFENLSDKYKTLDILVDKNNAWHLNGMPILPADLIDSIDIVWNVSNPSFSNILASLSIPYIGVDNFSFALQNNNDFLREHLKDIDVQIPKSILFPLPTRTTQVIQSGGYQKDFDGPHELYANKKAQEVLSKFPAPWVVKSHTEDTNMGIHLAKTFPELVRAIEDGVEHEKSILVEEFITGKIATAHSLPNFRRQDSYTFPILSTQGNFSLDEKEKLTTLVKKLHKHIGAKHYLKSDFVVSPGGKIYLLQINGTPIFKQGSHLSEAVESVGAKMHHVIEHILEQA